MITRHKSERVRNIKTPIYDRLKEISSKDITYFQLPGHKKRVNSSLDFNLLPSFDTTETYGTDNLHEPQEIISESMKEISRVYKSQNSLYLVNGSTSGIHIAMMSVTKPGDTVLIQRNSHVSAYNGSIIGRLNVEYIMPEYDAKRQIVGGLDVAKFKEIVECNPSIKACILLHPSFYGLCSNLREIIEIAHKNGIIVIVDEAHGPHLSFSDKLPDSAIDLGADLVVHSAHKTLPSLTQTAILHICTDRVSIDRVRTVSRLLQTTSPSYIFMTSIEKAVAYMDSNEGRLALDELVCNVVKFNDRISKIDGIKLLDEKSDKLFFERDITKIHLEIEGIKGTDLIDILHRDYNINMEYADLRYVIGVASVMNTKEDFDRLADAIEDIVKRVSFDNTEQIDMKLLVPKQIIPIYEAFNSDTKTVKLKESIGFVSASYIIPYPPGIPQLAPGELITEKHIEMVEMYGDKGISIVGLNEDKIDIIEV